MLVAQGLTKAYGPHEVVSDVELSLGPGRVVGLVGANGAGKSTTIKMLTGIVEPTAGTAMLEGRPTLEPATRSRIGYLPEDSPLYDEETARSYLRFFGSIYGLSRREADERAERLLRRLHLDEAAWNKTIGTMSKGMRRKVAIARTVLHDPAVLLLDEPTSGLDPITAGELGEFIREQRGAGKAVLLSAHDLPQVEELCDEIVVMHRGRLVAKGTLTDLRGAWGTQRYTVRATVGFDGSEQKGGVHVAEFGSMGEVETVMDVIRQAGGLVLDVEAAPPRLDEILRRVIEA